MTLVPFTDHEKSRIKHFLGYPSWSALTNGIQLGIPAGSHALFLVEQSFQRLDEGGVQNARSDLEHLESIEEQMRCARSRVRAKRLGEIETNLDEMGALNDELERWRSILANDMGVPINPYPMEQILGGINGRRG